MKKHAKLVVFEGPDQVGKGTQSELALEALKKVGAKVVRVKAPHIESERTYRLIYWMLRSGWAKRLANTFQFIQFINKMIFQLFYLPALVSRNDIIIFDRWGLSAVVYGTASGVNPRFNIWLYGFIKKADLTIVFADRSYRRTTTEDDSYEKDSDLQTRVRELYKNWALSHSEDHVLVSNDKSVEDIHREVMDRIITPCRVCGSRVDEDCDAGLHS